MDFNYTATQRIATEIITREEPAVDCILSEVLHDTGCD